MNDIASDNLGTGMGDFKHITTSDLAEQGDSRYDASKEGDEMDSGLQ
jgi:hypothetical protein